MKSWAARYGLVLGTIIENWPSQAELDLILVQLEARSEKDSPPSVTDSEFTNSTLSSVIDFESTDSTTRAWLIAPLSELDFSVRAQNIFANLGLRTVGDLVACSEADLRRAGNCGRTDTERDQPILSTSPTEVGYYNQKLEFQDILSR